MLTSDIPDQTRLGFLACREGRRDCRSGRFVEVTAWGRQAKVVLAAGAIRETGSGAGVKA